MDEAKKESIRQMAAQIAGGIVTGHADESNAERIAEVAVKIAEEIWDEVEALDG